MQHSFNIQIAGLTVKISCKYPLSYELSKAFLADDSLSADIVVSVSEEAIAFEAENSDEITTPDYAEFICIYRMIAEQLPNFGCFVFHGAAISYEDDGYVFTAQSGTGKSTHIKLWRQFLGKSADIINGDKPIIKITQKGVFVCSTPWAGKENWKKNRICKLDGIAFLERSKNCFAKKIDQKEAFSKIINQVYLPKKPEALTKTLDNIGILLSEVPLVQFGCDISENAVKTSFEALTNYKYEEKRLK